MLSCQIEAYNRAKKSAPTGSPADAVNSRGFESDFEWPHVPPRPGGRESN